MAIQGVFTPNDVPVLDVPDKVVVGANHLAELMSIEGELDAFIDKVIGRRLNAAAYARQVSDPNFSVTALNWGLRREADQLHLLLGRIMHMAEWVQAPPMLPGCTAFRNLVPWYYLCAKEGFLPQTLTPGGIAYNVSVTVADFLDAVHTDFLAQRGDQNDSAVLSVQGYLELLSRCTTMRARLLAEVNDVYMRLLAAGVEDVSSATPFKDYVNNPIAIWCENERSFLKSVQGTRVTQYYVDSFTNGVYSDSNAVIAIESTYFDFVDAVYSAVLP